MSLDEEPKAQCWRPKQALIECVLKTKCFEEMKEVEPCIAAAQCFHERKNWVLCKTNVLNPRYRLRGNPYDVASEDTKKIEARNERIARRMAEEQGLSGATVYGEGEK
jgi:cytochrome c oxidase assembly factor 5